MISVITCFRNDEMVGQLSANIANTIGHDYEFIKVENKTGCYSLTEAYNLGAAQAKYDYLCFVHEDVLFRTDQWGHNLLAHFKADAQAGVIGIAGSVYKIKMVSSWWQPELSELEPKRINLIQHYKKAEKTAREIRINPLFEQRSKVVSLDGVFMAVRKEVWKQFRFDDVLLKGFHGYDLDFTLRIGSRYSNYVIYDILLEHFSEGVNDQNWLRDNYRVHLKNKKLLPSLKEGRINPKALRQVDKSYLERNFNLAVRSAMQKKEMCKMFLSLIVSSRLLKPNVPFLKRFMKTLVQR